MRRDGTEYSMRQRFGNAAVALHLQPCPLISLTLEQPHHIIPLKLDVAIEEQPNPFIKHKSKSDQQLSLTAALMILLYPTYRGNHGLGSSWKYSKHKHLKLCSSID
jgi:hypothetical protein